MAREIALASFTTIAISGCAVAAVAGGACASASSSAAAWNPARPGIE
jgi:hypothetical protein